MYRLTRSHSSVSQSHNRTHNNQHRDRTPENAEAIAPSPLTRSLYHSFSSADTATYNVSGYISKRIWSLKSRVASVISRPRSVYCHSVFLFTLAERVETARFQNWIRFTTRSGGWMGGRGGREPSDGPSPFHVLLTVLHFDWANPMLHAAPLMRAGIRIAQSRSRSSLESVHF